MIDGIIVCVTAPPVGKDYNAIMGAINKSYLASVVQRGDDTIQQINYYPADKNYINQLSYPVDSDLSSE